MAETWVLNSNLQGQYDDRELVSSIAFVSKDTLYSKIAVGPQLDRALRYNDNEVWAWKTGWLDQAYRTITFDAAPTGELLTWLQANGVKQQGKHTNKVVVNGETILDLTQDTVTTDKMVSGVTAHDKSGKQITGTMGELAGLAYTGGAITTPGSGGSYSIPASYIPEDTRYVKGNDETVVNVTIPKTKFGNATAADVVKGKYFSSETGIAQTGTYVPLDTSDATATASDIAKGKTAYVKGAKVTGSLLEVKSASTWQQNCTSKGLSGDTKVVFRLKLNTELVFRNGSTCAIMVPLTEFGNATAADVAKGKTFTSVAGLKVTGTAEGSSAADVTFELYNNGFNNLAVVYMSKTDGVMQTTIPNSDHMPITTSEGSMVALVNQSFDGNTINLIPDNGVHIAQGWRTANVTLFVAGAETNGMNIDVEIV